jgi:putative hydrolase of the HAD superfamily
MTKAVLLDLGNVIVGLDFDRAYRAAALRSPFSVSEIRGRIRAAALSDPYERGEISSEEFWRRFCQALEMNGVSFGEFQDLWGDMFQPAPLLPEGLLAHLGARHRLVLVSNTNDIHFRWIERRYPLLRHFHEYVLSYRVGEMKPAPRIFQEAIRLAGCAAEECFFSDDNAANIEGARRLGIDAALFRGEEDLRSQLELRQLL